jgi:lactate permease
MAWEQNYDPLHNVFLSTVVAAVPVVVLLGTIAFLKIRIHFAALIGLAVSLAIAVGAFHMPAKAAAATAIYGAAYGLFPIGWIILNLIFLYQLTVDKGLFAVLRGNLASIAPDPRVQVILIAFSFGAFFEGAAGFGTPVAVTAAILIQLGFKPLAASGLSLIANTAPVAFGALGTPILALAGVTGIDEHKLSAMVGRQLPFFSLLVPFWVVWAMSGLRGMLGVWPAALTAGVAFAIPQFLVSNFHGPWLVDIVASLCSMAALVVLMKFWRPREIWKLPESESAGERAASVPLAEFPESGRSRESGSGTLSSRREVMRAWVPWILLSVFVFIWGVPQVKRLLNGERIVATATGFNKQSSAFTKIDVNIPALHNQVKRGPQVAGTSTAPEKAVFTFNWLSATGSGILVAALVSGLFMGYRLGQLVRIYLATLWRVRFSLITIAAMLALGYVTKYSGTDATLGLALSRTGVLYPFFGTLLGWLGVALTGSDTASNVLFGSLQKISAEQAGVSPTLMAAANSSGGVMGKMVDAQSIVVASTATNWYGHEGSILRYVFFHSIALAILVGILVFLQAYVAPFSSMVVR